MAPAKQCSECNKSQVNAKFIKCGECHLDFHTSCAARKIPTLTEPMIDLINKSKGGVLFKCQLCLNNPKTKASNNDVSYKLSELEASIKQLSKIVSEDIVSQLKDIKTEVASCYLKATSTENFVTSKIQHLELENVKLRRQINRSDIVIFGLPDNYKVDELYKTVFDIGKFFNVEIGHSDLNVCTYIRKKKAVLVKFNSIYKRDVTMKKYFEFEELKRCDILETNDTTRIYFNDNLTPQAAKLNYLCRQLRKEEKITKFKFFNKIVPEAKIFLPGGGFKLINLEKMIAMDKAGGIDEGEINTQFVAE